MPRDESSAQRAARLRLGRLPGYVRQPDPARRGGEDGRAYKKGWEVRFTARSEEEITEIRELVTAAGFAPARPFFKGHQLIQPVYGIAAVQAYLAAREAAEAAGRAARRSAGIPVQTRREPDSVAAAVRAAESAAAEAAADAAARAGVSGVPRASAGASSVPGVPRAASGASSSVSDASGASIALGASGGSDGSGVKGVKGAVRPVSGAGGREGR